MIWAWIFFLMGFFPILGIYFSIKESSGDSSPVVGLFVFWGLAAYFYFTHS